MGAFTKALIIFTAAVLGLIFIVFIFKGQSVFNGSGLKNNIPTPTYTSSNSGGTDNTTSGSKNNTNTGSSISSYKVSISSGNASSEVQPIEEYITIRNSGSTGVNITGWKLKNSKGDRPIQNSQNSYFYPSPEYVVIPQGTKFLSPDSRFLLEDIILAPGETAVLVTGGPYVQYRFPIPVSFHENICTGYLESDVYTFKPNLLKSCPNLNNDPGLSSVTKECSTYVKSLNKCEDPEKEDKAKLELQPTLCQNFVKARANYPSCVALHKNDANFYTGTKKWRVFLGRKSEMWAKGDDVITLIDRQGNIVDTVSY